MSTFRNRESEIFAHQFLRAFQNAGWSVNFVVTDLPERELDSGVIFPSFEGNTPPSRPDFSTLGSGLRAGRNRLQKGLSPAHGNLHERDHHKRPGHPDWKKVRVLMGVTRSLDGLTSRP